MYIQRFSIKIQSPWYIRALRILKRGQYETGSYMVIAFFSMKNITPEILTVFLFFKQDENYFLITF